MQVFVHESNTPFDLVDRILHRTGVGYLAKDANGVRTFRMENLQQLLRRTIDAVKERWLARSLAYHDHRW